MSTRLIRNKQYLFINTIFANVFANIFNEHISKCIVNSWFPDELRVVKVVPIFKNDSKKDSKTLKSSYRLLSIFSNESKLFEKSKYDQLTIFFWQYVLKTLIWILKGLQCPTIPCCLYNKKTFAALLTNFPRAFDCVNCESLIAQLHVYG